MDPEDRVELNAEELRQKINLETGRIGWPELQRFFARGVVIVVGPEVDLIEAAAAFAEDDRQVVERWVAQGQINRAQDDDAKRWQGANTEFWSVVVAPWVLVQELKQ